ncbi:Dysbindin [Dermatophagoides pteronyssinus]|uniref:Dysbindin protein homolog n=2 Tax=Dermatophagoides pteronyssinus TaxID=6956 RepID=A0A6P6YHI1_DERPT|nr:dysbindin protein homolog [Dermatophagoides pteronyssinus]KAH9424488.1 Dysbindin [Dermatophagoides pteronyssinus]
MFVQQIRDRLQNLVQQDLQSSLRELTIGTLTSNHSATSTSIDRSDFHRHYDDLSDVNLLAGIDIVDYFQQRWIELQNQTKQNVTNAKHSSKTIQQIKCKFENFNKICDDLETDLDRLVPEICESLLSIEIELEQSLSLVNKLNEAIIGLNKESIDQDFEQRKSESEQKMNQMLVRRAEDLVLYESQLNSKYERQEVEILKERQLVFQQAFEDELRIYKEKGQLINNEPPSSSSLSKDETKLEDISLDLDPNEVDELEKFLEND